MRARSHATERAIKGYEVENAACMIREYWGLDEYGCLLSSLLWKKRVRISRPVEVLRQRIRLVLAEEFVP